MKKYLIIAISLILLIVGFLFLKDKYTNNFVSDSITNYSTTTNKEVSDSNNLATNSVSTSSTEIETGNNTGYSISDVAKHNTSEDCWSVVDNKVYVLSSFTNKHPGGVDTISQMCGKDGTELFYKVHGGQSKPLAVLSKLYLALYLK